MNTISREAYEGDIASRLRNWRGLHLAHGGELFEAAAAEIERLRSQPCPYVVGTVTRHCSLTPFTLTDEEREAIGFSYRAALPETEKLGGNVGEYCRMHRDTLRTLLERTK
jgi:hypothetical protein